MSAIGDEMLVTLAAVFAYDDALLLSAASLIAAVVCKGQGLDEKTGEAVHELLEELGKRAKVMEELSRNLYSALE